MKMYKPRFTLYVCALALLSFGAFAQSSPPSCSTTSTISTNSGPIILGTDNECLQINSGITVSGPSDAVNNSAARDVQINNQGTINGATGIFSNLSTSIYSLTNSSLIDATSSGVYNGGAITNLINSGTIRGVGEAGILVDQGSINTLENSGNILSNARGIRIQDYISGAFVNGPATGSINTLINTGSIQSFFLSAIDNWGRVGTLTNSLIIESMVSNGISNQGTIGTLTNNSGATIRGDEIGIFNQGTSSTVSVLVNAGNIFGTMNLGIRNEGTIGTLTNNSSGAIAGLYTGIYNLANSNLTTLNNSGTISGNTSYGIDNEGTIITLSNSSGGSILGGQVGIVQRANVTITTLNNSGTILGTSNTGIDNDGTIVTLTNNGGGSIQGGQQGVLNRNTINTLNNSGTISGTLNSGIDNLGMIGTLTNNSGASLDGGSIGLINRTAATITTLNNSGTIFGTSNYGIDNLGTIGTLTNNSGASISGDTRGIANAGTIDFLNNSGTILGVTLQGIDNYRAIVTLTNNNGASISGAEVGVVNRSTATITALNNSGTILGTSNTGIDNEGTIVTLTNNSGASISGDQIGIFNRTNSTISALTNTGNISAGVGGYGIVSSGIITAITNAGAISASSGGYGIGSNGSIATLNNAQGGNGSSPATTALTYTGNLPANYNIIVRSLNSYGQLAVTNPGGASTFGIYGGGVSGVAASVLAKGTYVGVLSGVTSTNLNNTSGTFNGFRWSLSNSSADIWDLIVTGASTADTQQSLVNTASVLQGTYTLQNSVMVNGFTYDCSLFDRRGICVSAGGRNTTVQAQGINNTSGLLIASYRLSKNNSRIGAWVDQNLSVSGPGTVKLGNSTPMIGLFGVWSQRPDGVGAEVKVSAAYGQKDTTITRQIVGTSEAGSGGSQLISQGAQVVAKYGFAVMPAVVISPYVGVRYTQNNMGGYTEATSSAVTTPLTYSALNTNATTALAGVGARYQAIPKTTLFASAGVETDTNTSNGSYSATGVDGLTPVNFNPNPVKTRPTATVGGYYDILKNQRIGVTGIYRQEPFQAVSTTTVLATYTIGL